MPEKVCLWQNLETDRKIVRDTGFLMLSLACWRDVCVAVCVCVYRHEVLLALLPSLALHPSSCHRNLASKEDDNDCLAVSSCLIPWTNVYFVYACRWSWVAQSNLLFLQLPHFFLSFPPSSLTEEQLYCCHQGNQTWDLTLFSTVYNYHVPPMTFQLRNI